MKSLEGEAQYVISLPSVILIQAASNGGKRAKSKERALMV